ncbi:MAG: hypothetical protein K2G85_02670 [Muribaculaceae bacterium]|nr:hypothetical protein [Muribaculaceae bacterium]
MKKLFSTIVALSLTAVGFTAAAENSSEATPEANPGESAVCTQAPEATPAVSPAVAPSVTVEVPELIAEHLSVRFPGSTVYGITREGVTYVVDLGDGLHIRYDNCFNPVCYGVHNHDY